MAQRKGKKTAHAAKIFVQLEIFPSIGTTGCGQRPHMSSSDAALQSDNSNRDDANTTSTMQAGFARTTGYQPFGKPQASNAVVPPSEPKVVDEGDVVNDCKRNTVILPGGLAELPPSEPGQVETFVQPEEADPLQPPGTEDAPASKTSFRRSKTASSRRHLPDETETSKWQRSHPGQDGVIPLQVWRDGMRRLKIGDHHPLRVLRKIEELEKVPICNMKLNVAFVEGALRRHSLHKNPGRYARQILLCFGRYLEENPSLGDFTFESVEDKRVYLLPESDRPAKLSRELDEWKQNVPVVMHGKPNPSNALAPVTIEGYATAFVTVVTVFHAVHGRLSHDIGLEFLCQPKVVVVWMHYLSKRQAPSTIQGTIAGVLRIARDSRVNPTSIAFLEARLSDYVKLGSEADTARIARLASADRFIALRNASGQLMLRAEDPNNYPVSRLAAGCSAVAIAFMFENPDISEEFVARLDLDRQVTELDGTRLLHRPDRVAPEPLSPAISALIDRLRAVYQALSVVSPYLLPGVDGRPRATRSALEMVYNELQGIIGERLVRTDMRDINVHLGLEAPDCDPDAIASGSGYKEPRSMMRRHGHKARRRHRRGQG